MGNKYAVEFKNASKIFQLKKANNEDIYKRKMFYALKDVSFKIEQGEVVGVLGSNGSGKSTLSAILAGVSEVDEGEVKIIGEQALIAINAGLNNQLTGYENIELKGALLGLSKKRIKEITEGVIEFAELGDFLYQPVKNYSSGMKARLGFSISINLNPDIVIIDEALSVGDSAFSAKCLNKINEFKDNGKTIFFISHSLNQVKSFCNKGLWIEGGRLREYGDIETVAKNYNDYLEAYKKLNNKEKNQQKDKIFKERIVEIENKGIKLFYDKLKKRLKKVKKR